MTSALTRLSGSAFELTLNVPWPEVKAIYDRVFDELAEDIEIQGFRKGKAPKDLVAQRIEKSKIYDEVIKRIIPDAYVRTLKEHGLKPIVNPQVKIVSGEEEKDWQFIAKAAEKPTVDLDDYKKHVAAINAKASIWKPGDSKAQENQQTTTPVSSPTDDDSKSKKINEIINKLLEVCKLEIPELLIDSEVNRLLAHLIDDIRAAGLTYEQYLASKVTTSEQLRLQYQNQVAATLKLELVLEAIADDLGLVVEEKEINEIIDREQDPKKKEDLRAQSYYLSSLLRREKTLTKLASL